MLLIQCLKVKESYFLLLSYDRSIAKPMITEQCFSTIAPGSFNTSQPELATFGKFYLVSTARNE